MTAALLFPSVGPMELALIVLLVLLVFGASRLSDLGRGLGEGIRNFKKGLAEEEAPADAPPAGRSAPTEKRPDSTD